jgi:hypothetical protein
VAAFHQSHKQTAYSDGLFGHDINERYTYKKWGGIPWTGLENDPLKVKMHQNRHELVLSVKRKTADEQTMMEQHGFV